MIDGHVHVWDPAARPYTWLEGAGLNRPMSAQLHAQVSESAGQIFVEANVADADGLAEANWVMSQPWQGLLGIVARINLDEPESVATTLNSYRDFAAGDRSGSIPVSPASAVVPIVGVRHLLQHLPQIDHYGPGIAEVLKSGLAFDVCITHGQLPEAVALLTEVHSLAATTDTPVQPTPGQLGNLVIDHLAKPDVDAGLASETGQAWLAGMAALAALPRTYLKLSGLVPESSSPEAFATHAPSFVRAGLELFGPQRCLFASDWPVSSQSKEQYQAWVALVQDVCGADWEQVSTKSALDAYQLGT